MGINISHLVLNMIERVECRKETGGCFRGVINDVMKTWTLGFRGLWKVCFDELKSWDDVFVIMATSQPVFIS